MKCYPACCEWPGFGIFDRTWIAVEREALTSWMVLTPEGSRFDVVLEEEP
jgi:hypothetical protein